MPQPYFKINCKSSLATVCRKGLKHNIVVCEDVILVRVCVWGGGSSGTFEFFGT